MASRDTTTEDGAVGVERCKRRPITERFQTSVAMVQSLPKEGKNLLRMRITVTFPCLSCRSICGRQHN